MIAKVIKSFTYESKEVIIYIKARQIWNVYKEPNNKLIIKRKNVRIDIPISVFDDWFEMISKE